MSQPRTLQTAAAAMARAMARAGFAPDALTVESYTEQGSYYDHWGWLVRGPRDLAARGAAYLKAWAERDGARGRFASGDRSMRPVARSLEIRSVSVSWAGRPGTEYQGELVCFGSYGIGD